jgi:hypothetical protein
MFKVHWLMAMALCAIGPGMLRGQSGDNDTGEASVFGGGSFGLGTHPVVGGDSGFAFSRYAMFLFGGSFTPMGNDILWQRPDIKSPQDGNLYDFNTSIHIRVPVRDKWAPYAILGGGLLFNSYNAAIGPQGALIRVEDFKFGFHTGGGVRYYVRENWGIRPEFRVIVSSRTYTRFTVGVFFTFPSLWP